MQTFLPYENFYYSAIHLDRQRLGKQRVEGMQILKILLGLAKVNKHGNIAWRNHTVVRMWEGYEKHLIDYTLTIIQEWKDRGYIDNLFDYVFSMRKLLNGKYQYPHFLGNKKFHLSHRRALLSKDYEYYKYYWKLKPIQQYYYPQKEGV